MPATPPSPRHPEAGPGWKSRLRWALVPFLAALFLTLPVLGQQRAGEDDVGFLTRTLQGFLSDAGREVRIQGFEGALSSRARMEEMTIADDEGVWLILRDVVLDWSRAALLNRRIEVNELGAGEIILLRQPGTAEDTALPSATAREPFTLPELPVSVNIGQVRADSVQIGEAVFGEAAHLSMEGAMQLADGSGTASFLARRIDGQEGEFRFNGGFNNETRRLVLDLVLSEGPGGLAATLLSVPGAPAMALSVVGDDPIESFEAAISLSTEGIERVAGTVTLLDSSPEQTLLDGLNFALDVAGDLRPLLAPEMHAFFGAESRLRAQGARSEEGDISLSELTLRTRTTQVVGRAELSPSMVPELVDVFVRIDDPDGGMVPLPGGGGDLRLRRADLTVEYDAEIAPDWLVLAEIEELGTAELEAARIALDARGLFSTGQPGVAEAPAPAFDGTFEFAVLGIRSDDPALQQALGETLTGFMGLQWQGGSPLEITGVAIEARNAMMTAQGTLDGLTFDGFVEAEIPSMVPFSALAGRALGGHVLAVSRGEFDALSGAFDLDLSLITTDLSIDQNEFDNLVAGEATIGMQIARDSDGTTLRNLRLRAGALELNAQGHARPEDTALAVRFSSGNLGALGPGYGGRIDLSADFASDGTRDRLSVDGTMRDLAPGEVPGADALRGLLQGNVAISAQAERQDGIVTVDHLQLDGARLAMALSGRWSRAQSDLALALERLQLEAIAPQMAGTLSGIARLQGETHARQLTVDLASAGALRTGTPQIDALLQQGLRVQGAVRETGRDAFALENLQVSANGLTANARGVQQADGAARFVLNAGLTDLARVQAGFSGPASLETTVTRAAGEQAYDVRLTLDGPSALTLQGEGRINGMDRVSMRLTGSVDAAIANPQIEPATIQGLARIDARVDGPLALRSLRGTVRVDSGRFVRPDVGFALQDIRLDADISGSMVQLRMDGAVSRGGRLSAQGSLFLEGEQDVDIALTAEQMRIYQPRIFEGTLSGNARLMGPLQRGALVSGTLTVNEAEIRIPNAPLSRAGYIPDGLTHVGESAASRRTRINAGIISGERRGGGGGTPLRLDLTLDAPSRVFVRGRGLDAELGGSLRLTGTTQDIIPSGGFTLIRGRLDLLGSRFNLTEGIASLVGSFTPFVRLVATTDSDGVATSIILEGEADALNIRFESSPELPEDEVLARLIFRRSLTSLSPFQAAQLAMSVATLTGFSDNSFLSRTRAALGLDDLDLTTDADGTTAVRAGRYIGERVYSDVSVDSTGRAEVSINLDLTQSLTLRGRTNTEGRTGLGVFFERDY
ncbi:MAG: translocation/assembly module TamB domain-containing protein [Pararhodobacter sp.]